MATYVVSNEAGPTSGATFNYLLKESGAVSGSTSWSVPSGATHNIYAVAPTGDPGAAGFSGPYTVEFTVTAFQAGLFCNARAARMNTGFALTLGTLSPAQTINQNKTYTFTLPTESLGTWSAGDRLLIEIQVGNSSGLTRTLTSTLGTTDCEVTAPWRSLLPGLTTNNQNFFSPTVSPGAVSLSPSLLNSSASIFAPILEIDAAFLDVPKLTNTNTFHAPTVTPGAIALVPGLLTNGNTFFGPTFTLDLTPSLVTNSQTFHAPTVVPGAVSLTSGLLTNGQTFFSPTVTPGEFSLLPSLYSNEQTFFAPIITTGDWILAPSLVSNDQTFFSPTLNPGAVDLLPPLVTETTTLFGPTITVGDVTLLPQLLDTGALVYVPVVTAGAVTVEVPLLTNDTLVYVPIVRDEQTLLAPLLVSEAQVIPPDRLNKFINQGTAWNRKPLLDRMTRKYGFTKSRRSYFK